MQFSFLKPLEQMMAESEHGALLSRELLERRTMVDLEQMMVDLEQMMVDLEQMRAELEQVGFLFVYPTIVAIMLPHTKCSDIIYFRISG